MSNLGDDTRLSISAFIRAAIGEGMGVTQARNALRSSGAGRMGNAEFGQLYGQIRDAVGMRSSVAQLDYDALPPGEAYSTWAAGEAGRYASFVEVYVRPMGARDVTSKWYQHVTTEPHTPQSAIDAAIDVIMGGSQSGLTPSGEVIVGAAVTSITRTVDRAA